LSSGSVPGSTSGVVVRRNVYRTAENPVPRRNVIEILEKWSTAGIAAVLSTPGQEAARHAFYQLTPLAHSLLRHCLRLDQAARRLEGGVRERRRGNGWKATRQIELERQRLGRELHTGVGQMLAAVRLQLELISANLADPPATVRQALEKISILVRDALEEVRSVSKRLHPPEWQRLTLESALRQLWGMSGVPETYQTTFHIDPIPSEPDLNRKVLVYRCLQEALSNVSRHSRAKQVSVDLRVTEGLLILTVTDDGVGFDVVRLFSGPPGVPSGIGLQAVREHAAALGGSLEIQSGPHGTTLELSVPLPATQT
jgi:signal transduction histidine kinase